MDREFPVDPDSPLWERVSQPRPQDPIQALMECAPGDEPDVSQLELLGVRDLLADAIEQLEPQEQWMITRSVIEKWPIRQIAKVLGIPKSTAWDIRERALRSLRSSLSSSPAVQAVLRTSP